MNAFSVLDSLFDPAHPAFTEDGMRTLLELKSSKTEQARMSRLAAKANEGTLTSEERRTYEAWVRAGTFISLLQAKARLFRKKLKSSE